MLRYSKLFILYVVIAAFMACSAPTSSSTSSSISEVPVVEVDEKPSTGVPGLPGDIGSIIGSARNYWAGRTSSGEYFYLSSKDGFDEEWGWRVQIIDNSGHRHYFYALSSGISGVMLSLETNGKPLSI